MIFKQFDPNQDVVAGRITRVASGFWPNGLTNWSQSAFVDDFWSLTGSVPGTTPSYGTSYYDIRRTMYYTNVYPHESYKNNSDPYFSVAYGHIGGDVGSGSFMADSESIHAYPTKVIYTQYKNMLIEPSDSDGMFTMISASSTVKAKDIWIIDFSAYKMKDRIDEGLLEFTLSGSGNTKFTFIDNSIYSSQNQLVYQIITGSVSSPTTSPIYEGLGLFYPNNGIIILNAELMAKKLGQDGTNTTGFGYESGGPSLIDHSWPYRPGIEPVAQYTYNHRTLFWALKQSDAMMQVRKTEYVPARHYFIRVMNREFNYSNNPTYVWDGLDGKANHTKGTIRNSDFINDPKTYLTTIGLYNENNELLAVAKLSRPAVKSFENELLIKIRLDF